MNQVHVFSERRYVNFINSMYTVSMKIISGRSTGGASVTKKSVPLNLSGVDHTC